MDFFGQFFKVVYGRGAAAEALAVGTQQAQEGFVAHDDAEHLEHHGAFVADDGVELGRKRRELVGVGDGRGRLVHQSADGEVLQRLLQAGGAGGTLDVEGFRVARKTGGKPDIARRRWTGTGSPPLGGDAAGQQARAERGAPLTRGEQDQAGRGVEVPRVVIHFHDGDGWVLQRAELVGEEGEDVGRGLGVAGGVTRRHGA